MSEAVIECRGVVKTYDDAGSEITVLSGADLKVAPGERVAIVGASGAGKSTLLHVLGGLDQFSDGEIHIAGQSLAGLGQKRLSRLRNQHLGFVYQFHHLLPEFSALENVAMPLLIAGSGAADASSRAEALLERVGLKQRLTHKPGQMSGGERQRAAVARALVTQPSCVLADEPTGNLDEENASQVFDLMLELNADLKTSLIIVTHDQALAQRLDRVLTLSQGQLHETTDIT
ncbi:MAG: lipoprotein-releasing ABC transporter ATP-binding protein LolD [Pseudomonadota bacterium]